MTNKDFHKEKKKQIYGKYEEGFQGLPLCMNPFLEDSEPNFWLSCLLIDKGCEVSPIDILQKLYEEGIESRPLWKPMHMQPVFQDCDFISCEEKGVNEDLFKRGLCLPSDIKMTEEEQDRVIAIIRSCFEV